MDDLIHRIHKRIAENRARILATAPDPDTVKALDAGHAVITALLAPHQPHLDAWLSETPVCQAEACAGYEPMQGGGYWPLRASWPCPAVAEAARLLGIEVPAR